MLEAVAPGDASRLNPDPRPRIPVTDSTNGHIVLARVIVGRNMPGRVAARTEHAHELIGNSADVVGVVFVLSNGLKSITLSSQCHQS
jgi:hypothetical protein